MPDRPAALDGVTEHRPMPGAGIPAAVLPTVLAIIHALLIAVFITVGAGQ